MRQREIMLHTIMVLQQQQQHEISMQFLRALQPQDERDFELMESAGNNTTAETVPTEVRTTRTTSNRVSELPQVEKPLQAIEKSQTPYDSYHEAEKIARYLYDLKNSYVILAQNRFLIQQQYEKDFENIPQLDARANIMKAKIEKINTMRCYVAELKAERQKLHFWEHKRKSELDTEIDRVETDIRVAENHFNSKYHIPLHEVSFEIDRIRNEARFKERELERKNGRMTDMAEELEAINTEYLAKWELAEKRADIDLIENLLSQMGKPHVFARDNLRQVQVERNIGNRKKRKN